MTVRHDGLQVTWFGYATTRIETEGGFVAYLDPGRYGVLTGEWTPIGGGNPKEAAHPRSTEYRPGDADLVCVTHDHHYDSEGIRRVANDGTTVVVYEAVDPAGIDRDVDPVSELPGEVVRIGEEDHLAVDGVDGGADVWSMPAYNEPDGPRNGHPKGFGVGYRLALGGTSVFWPGDSDALDAFAELSVSLFLANIAGTVVSSADESAELAERMDPDLVLPVHYNTIEILQADSGEFARDVAKRGVPVVLDEQEG
ncbi:MULTISPECIES: MBL fold metallo-hydrolase [Halolamina]|uniref:L-ascorbate metabolism protein UlaG, beta-lactamase superfamily n=1 Tax=Halolamina pelagica TaxID=699431 RepID=A0A1I5VBL5_9EURY|nr:MULTISPECIES: MBL fold metallo-hydrolase [Halolamina]NHX37707.1 MBL fold metallo-hydrolase [Halolamina sp. R1-12]SFQ04850.1 L-ascorbate metabolism protein UlaG, beta-lactamase superfamily [Halolamina pelagica]